MKLRINLILAISFLGLVHAFAPRASAQQADAGMTNIREVNSLGTSVCEETEINPQVREALRLICIRTGADEKRPATSGLIVVGFLGGFAKSGDSNHPEVWFGAYLRQ